jgi:hypothetical protein
MDDDALTSRLHSQQAAMSAKVSIGGRVLNPEEVVGVAVHGHVVVVDDAAAEKVRPKVTPRAPRGQ